MHRRLMTTAAPGRPEVQSLSFVKDRKRLGRLFWNVTPTGDYSEDCELGGRLAVEYLAYEEQDTGGPGLLQHIVGSMPRVLTGVEIAFLQLVALQAKAGRGRARQINEYWTRCLSDEKAA